jgi:hypothetical protein
MKIASQKVFYSGNRIYSFEIAQIVTFFHQLLHHSPIHHEWMTKGPNNQYNKL